jgi:hypothetical protein
MDIDRLKQEVESLFAEKTEDTDVKKQISELQQKNQGTDRKAQRFEINDNERPLLKAMNGVFNSSISILKRHYSTRELAGFLGEYEEFFKQGSVHMVQVSRGEDPVSKNQLPDEFRTILEFVIKDEVEQKVALIFQVVNSYMGERSMEIIGPLKTMVLMEEFTPFITTMIPIISAVIEAINE